MITLYGFGESGNAYKVALMLALTGTPWRLEFVPFFAGGTRTPEFRALNEMGEVPVLLDGDLTLSQSGLILDYLAEKTGQFGPRDATERREILRWLLWDTHKGSAQVGTTRFQMNFLPPEKRPEAVIAFGQARLKAAFGVLDGHLKTRAFLVGDRATIADLACCSYLFYPEPLGRSAGRLSRHHRLAGPHPRPARLAAPLRPDAPRFPPRGPAMTDAFIYDALRSPRGKGRADGALNEVTALRLSAQILDATMACSGLTGPVIEDVIWGNVTQIGEQGGCLARSAVLASGLDPAIPGLSINRFCASGLEAVNLAANQVKGGAGDAYIAGGVEMMSRVPMSSDGAAIAVDPVLAMGTQFVPQGISADLIATEYGFSREEADALAVESQRRAARAIAEGRFARSLVPVRDINGLLILDQDEHPRPDTDMASLAKLNPAFQAMGEVMPGFDKVALLKYPHLERIRHIHHAGNSSGIVDGAAAVLVGSAEFGRAHGLTPRARIRATARIGTEPTIMLTGPVPVTERVLRAAGMTIADIDLFEVNEAFAAVVLRFQQAFQVDPARVNVNGGAIALGHPLGATGAILIGTLLDELERSGKSTGLATLCVASGMGAATIIERV